MKEEIERSVCSDEHTVDMSCQSRPDHEKESFLSAEIGTHDFVR